MAAHAKPAPVEPVSPKLKVVPRPTAPSATPSKAPSLPSVGAAKAKAQFLQLLHQVEAQRKPVAITRRGRVIAHLVPAPEDEKISNFDRIFGSMRGTVKITGDIVSPDWDAWGPEWR